MGEKWVYIIRDGEREKRGRERVLYRQQPRPRLAYEAALAYY
ncbi:MAG: hypothetical protein N2508_06025 [Anaerolineae bacterium]|nr:hypothetical protein [Anaerolineae bacterium]